MLVLPALLVCAYAQSVTQGAGDIQAAYSSFMAQPAVSSLTMVLATHTNERERESVSQEVNALISHFISTYDDSNGIVRASTPTFVTTSASASASTSASASATASAVVGGVTPGTSSIETSSTAPLASTSASASAIPTAPISSQIYPASGVLTNSAQAPAAASLTSNALLSSMFSQLGITPSGQLAPLASEFATAIPVVRIQTRWEALQDSASRQSLASDFGALWSMFTQPGLPETTQSKEAPSSLPTATQSVSGPSNLASAETAAPFSSALSTPPGSEVSAAVGPGATSASAAAVAVSGGVASAGATVNGAVTAAAVGLVSNPAESGVGIASAGTGLATDAGMAVNSASDVGIEPTTTITSMVPVYITVGGTKELTTEAIREVVTQSGSKNSISAQTSSHTSADPFTDSRMLSYSELYMTATDPAVRQSALTGIQSVYSEVLAQTDVGAADAAPSPVSLTSSSASFTFGSSSQGTSSFGTPNLGTYSAGTPQHARGAAEANFSSSSTEPFAAQNSTQSPNTIASVATNRSSQLAPLFFANRGFQVTASKLLLFGCIFAFF